MTIITINNPFSGEVVGKDITGLSQNQLDAYAQLIDEATLYELEGAGQTPEEWLVAYVEKVGPEEAGRVILGS